jgi:glutathione S-transferase
LNDITLYFAPHTCARVTLVVLETIGCEYELRPVRFARGEHRTPGYLELNPRGKVPALIYHGRVLTENVAIVFFLHGVFPDARLLPPAADSMDRARQLADLCFCATTLHPIVSRIRFPMFLVEGDEAVRSLYRRSVQDLRFHFDAIERHLEEGDWWYGDTWSALDPYLWWVWFRVTGAGFPGGDYPAFADHARRVEGLPQVQRMLAREAEVLQRLESEGLSFTPPPLPA